MADFDLQLSIVQHEFYSENNIEFLAQLLRSGKPLSDGTRNFIADVLLGKIKRKKGRTPNFNLELFNDYEECLESGMTHQQADEKLSLKYRGMGFGSITKSYQRMKPLMDECDRIALEEHEASIKDIQGRVKRDLEANVVPDDRLGCDELQYIQCAWNHMSLEEKKYWRKRMSAEDRESLGFGQK